MDEFRLPGRLYRGRINLYLKSTPPEIEEWSDDAQDDDNFRTTGEHEMLEGRGLNSYHTFTEGLEAFMFSILLF